MTTYILNMIVKNLFLYIFVAIIVFKLCDYKCNSSLKLFGVLVTSIISTVIYVIGRICFDMVMCIFLVYIFQSVCLKVISRINLSAILVSNLIGTTVIYVLLAISGIVEYIIQKSMNITNETINVVLTAVIEYVLISVILKTKRIKNGLSFLKKQNEYMDMFIINIGTLIITLCGLVGKRNDEVFKNLTFYIIVLGMLLIVTIQKLLIMSHKQKLVNDTINQYKEELQQKDEEIKNLTEEAFRVNKINHEFYNRQKALELAVKNMAGKSDVESGEEMDIINRIHEITQEHSKKMHELKNEDILPKTDIEEIDDMFTYMQSECRKNDINFKLKINGNIHFLINNLIEKSKLETLIGDHLRDAIIAINSSKDESKELLVILGIKNDIYELSVYDSGIEFEIDTLLKLGLEPATTHKEIGRAHV